MSELSLRKYLEFKNTQLQWDSDILSARSFCAPGMSTISLKSLHTSMRIIHISDLHFTNTNHTWDIDYNFFRDNTDKAGRLAVADFLINNYDKFGTDIIVFTGDLTDSGDAKDYELAEQFINKLENTTPSFRVYSVPGNHDYCWEGNLFFEDLFKMVQDLENDANFIKNVTDVLTGGASSIATAITIDINSYIVNEIKGYLTGFLHGICIPDDYVKGIADLFTATCEITLSPLDIPPIKSHISIKLKNNTDTADNNTRRQRFIDRITHGVSEYPRCVDFENGRLILLDSVQDKLDNRDANPLRRLAQGRLGTYQIYDPEYGLEKLVTDYQSERRSGKKLIVCLHHSPFSEDKKGLLEDSADFLAVCKTGIDCLLFGHTTPSDVWYQPRANSSSRVQKKQDYKDDNFVKYETDVAPLVNCENLEHAKIKYPITVLDLGCYQRITFFTNSSDIEYSWGNPPA